MKTPFAFGTIAAALFATPTYAGGPASWDISTDFSSVQGQSGWSYGYNVSNGPFTLMPESGLVPDSLHSWSVSWTSAPTYWTNIRQETNGVVSMHPQGTTTTPPKTPADHEAILRWTSPIAGTVHVATSVRKAVTCGTGNGVDWIIRHNGEQAATVFLPTGQLSTALPLSTIVSVVPGDVIDFVLNASGSHDHCDTTIITAAIQPLVLESTATWTTGRGANGHTYRLYSAPKGISWTDAEAFAVSLGGHLASSTSMAENNFIYAALGIGANNNVWELQISTNNDLGPWLGGHQPSGSPEPGGGYLWIDGSPFSYINWAPAEPNNVAGVENRIHLIGQNNTRSSLWNDAPHTSLHKGFVVELPQVLESTATWTTGQGGNGHTYMLYSVAGRIDWPTAEAFAVAQGGHLASVTSAQENAFIYDELGIGGNNDVWHLVGPDIHIGPWIGGYQVPGSPEPGEGYQWIDGEVFDFTSWFFEEPNNANGTENRIHYYGEFGRTSDWNDLDHTRPVNGLIVEIPLDCPADTNADGNVNVTDLLAVISAWGANPGPADINGDGSVNVTDLLAVISAWGTCP